ncbi:hypothetical protein SDC9_152261 [bioreactor metagenome]|uniref:Uncharacterized protein n=1 Tax=bioreactor metagenome TaxID=1076179 RepID=A0A645EUV9_9ZZZZ
MFDKNTHIVPSFCVIRKRKKGAPITAVRIPMGISVVMSVRDTLSTAKRKAAPKIIDKGIK